MKKNKIINILILVLLCVLTNNIYSQTQDIETILKQDSIIIGEQIEYVINAKVPKSSHIVFPELKDTISKHIVIIADIKSSMKAESGFNNYQKKYLITSFDTGYQSIGPIHLKIINNKDTNEYITSPNKLLVKPYVLLDTIPVDTIYSNVQGFVVFGKNGFKEEIEKNIPDSIKQNISTDSLSNLKNYIKEQLVNIFSSQLTKNAEIYNQDEIMQIIEASDQKMFIVDKTGILEDFIVAGSVDTVFVQEFQKVKSAQALFTVYRIKDINEDLLNTPFTFSELWYYIKHYLSKYWWVLVILLLISAAIVYFFKYYKKGIKPQFIKVPPKRPAHIIALEKLEIIRKEKIWSNGHIKEFYVQLTDVLREYIENRFDIYAVEMTTSEILDSISKLGAICSESEIIKLQQVLYIADSVKFAKYIAMQNENDLSMKNAIDFVEKTKDIESNSNNIERVEAEIEVVKDVNNL